MVLAETVKSSDVSLRNFRPGGESVVLEVMKESFRGLEDLSRVKKGLSNPAFNWEGAFIAEKAGSPVGCICFVNLPHPNWFEIHYLGVIDENSREATAEKLVSRAVQFAESKNPGFLKAFTIAVQPYVDIYKRFGFKPVRRTIRINLDLGTSYGSEVPGVETRDVSSDMAGEAGDVLARGLLPYWDWFIEEQGGAEAVAGWAKPSLEKGEPWISAHAEQRMAGVAWLQPDSYGPQDCRFLGVYVLPEFRSRGVGSVLLRESIRKANQLGQKRMSIYTMAYLDHLAPGAVLYLKSGGEIEAEYLHMERR